MSTARWFARRSRRAIPAGGWPRTHHPRSVVSSWRRAEMMALAAADQHEQAVDLLTSAKARQAFSLYDEPERLRDRYGDHRILISPDHPTPLRTKTHSHGYVPWTVAGAGVAPDGLGAYNEAAAAKSSLVFDEGYRLMEFFLG